MVLQCIILCLIFGTAISTIRPVIVAHVSINDAIHFSEWLDYHKAIGIEHFHLLDPTSKDEFVALIADSAVITVHKGKDALGFMSSMTNVETLWIFLNVGDFIFLRQHWTVQELLSQQGPDAMYSMPTCPIITNQTEFSAQFVLKRNTLRFKNATSTRYSIMLANRRSVQNSAGRTMAIETAPVVVFTASLKSKQEQRWYVEWLCSTTSRPITQLSDFMRYDSRDYSLACSAFQQLKTGADNDSNSEWILWFDSYYYTLRREFFKEAAGSGGLVEDSRPWQLYQHHIKLSYDSTPSFASDDPFYYDFVLSEPMLGDPDHVIDTLEYLRPGTPHSLWIVPIYGDLNIPLQLIQFCVEITIKDCDAVVNAVLPQFAQKLKSKPFYLAGTNVVNAIDYGYMNLLLKNFHRVHHYEESITGFRQKAHLRVLQMHHPEECHKGWKIGESMLVKPQPAMPSFLMYVISHDDTSEQMLHHTIFGDSNNSSSNGLLVPVRVRSSVFFEYIAYREVFPGRYLREWSELGYVGISTYKTVVKHGSMCTYELRRLLLAGVEKDYDVIPLVRSHHELLSTSVLMMGKDFRNAWDIVLSAMGYNVSTIRQYDRIKLFYRNSMFIKPQFLMRLSQFMSRAIETILGNAEVHALCSTDARYDKGSEEVSVKIFNSTRYQLFPFIMERLPSFFLSVEGARICQGTEDCPNEVNWFST